MVSEMSFGKVCKVGLSICMQQVESVEGISEDSNSSLTQICVATAFQRKLQNYIHCIFIMKWSLFLYNFEKVKIF